MFAVAVSCAHHKYTIPLPSSILFKCHIWDYQAIFDLKIMLLHKEKLDSAPFRWPRVCKSVQTEEESRGHVPASTHSALTLPPWISTRSSSAFQLESFSFKQRIDWSLWGFSAARKYEWLPGWGYNWIECTRSWILSYNSGNQIQ